MNKSNTFPFILLLVVTLFSTPIFAQSGRGRGRQGNQARNQQKQNRQNQGGRGLQQGESNMGRGRNFGNGPGNFQAAGGAVTGQQRQEMSDMREEEKLARDVYIALKDKWNDRTFSNIAMAESQHMSSVANLLSRYGIADPVIDNTPGKFTSPKFQQLYQQLVTKGSNSLEDALKVGLKIEEMDIQDLRAAIDSSNNQDVRRVFENLERGSRNHLRAFASRLRSVGGTYNATHLSQQEFDQIAATGGQQRGGPANGAGSGRRQGQQNMGRGQGQQGQGQQGRGQGPGQQGQGQGGGGKGKGRGRGNGG